MKRIINAFKNSIEGLKFAFIDEISFRQDLLICIILLPLAFLLYKSKSELILMLFSLFFLLIAELINSAIENIIDRIGTEYHILSKKAKDIGSASVLIAIINMIATWLIILF